MMRCTNCGELVDEYTRHEAWMNTLEWRESGRVREYRRVPSITMFRCDPAKARAYHAERVRGRSLHVVPTEVLDRVFGVQHRIGGRVPAAVVRHGNHWHDAATGKQLSGNEETQINRELELAAQRQHIDVDVRVPDVRVPGPASDWGDFGGF